MYCVCFVLFSCFCLKEDALIIPACYIWQLLRAQQKVWFFYMGRSIRRLISCWLCLPGMELKNNIKGPLYSSKYFSWKDTHVSHHFIDFFLITSVGLLHFISVLWEGCLCLKVIIYVREFLVNQLNFLCEFYLLQYLEYLTLLYIFPKKFICIFIWPLVCMMG